MRGALGNTLLLNIIIIFVSIIVIFFVSMLAYSKAYRAKNRIVEVIEKYGEYNSDAEAEIITSLTEMGYQLGSCDKKGKLKGNFIDNNTGYKYCIEEIFLTESNKKTDNEEIDSTDSNEETVDKRTSKGARYYKVTTNVQFYFPSRTSILLLPYCLFLL